VPARRPGDSQAYALVNPQPWEEEKKFIIFLLGSRRRQSVGIPSPGVGGKIGKNWNAKGTERQLRTQGLSSNDSSRGRGSGGRDTELYKSFQKTLL